jgi:dipeptidyl aminopeptidase/acylaminoacyl peptidase
MKAFVFFITLSTGLLFATNAYSLKPEAKYITRPDRLGMEYAEYKLTTPDGAILNSWIIFPGENSNETTLILAYGDSGNMSYWLKHAKALTDQGYTCVLFDYRGFGQSSKFEINPNQLYYSEFVTDLTTVVNWTKKNLTHKKIGLWTASMGTIIGAEYLTKNRLHFAIMEGIIENVQDLVNEIKIAKNKEILLPLNASNSIDIYDRIGTPILFFAGQKDQNTAIKNRGYLLNPRFKRKIIDFDGGHLEGFQSMTKISFGDEYVAAISEFVKECPR